MRKMCFNCVSFVESLLIILLDNHDAMLMIDVDAAAASELCCVDVLIVLLHPSSHHQPWTKVLQNISRNDLQLYDIINKQTIIVIKVIDIFSITCLLKLIYVH